MVTSRMHCSPCEWRVLSVPFHLSPIVWQCHNIFYYWSRATFQKPCHCQARHKCKTFDFYGPVLKMFYVQNLKCSWWSSCSKVFCRVWRDLQDWHLKSHFFLSFLKWHTNHFSTCQTHFEVAVLTNEKEKKKCLKAKKVWFICWTAG